MKNFEKFGLMLDCSRNAVASVSSLKRLIIILEKMGYDSLALYIEDTYEVKDEPRFGYLRGRYSEEELKEVVAFGEKHNVEIVPWIQSLAHLNAIFRWEEYAPILDASDVVLSDDDRTYKLFENIFDSLSRVFKGPYINIGMDETEALGLGKHLQKHGYEPPEDIYFRHLGMISKIATEHGFKPLMWGDMLLRYGSKKTEAFKNYNVSPIYWDYYSDERSNYDKKIEAYQKITDDLWFAGGAWTWGGGFAPLTSLAMRCSKPAIESCVQHHVNKFFMTCWGDNGNECSPYSVLPALYYAKCIAEGEKSIERIKEGFFSLFGVSFDDFLLLETPNYLSYGPKPGNDLSIVNPSKCLFYNDPLTGTFDLSVRLDDDDLYASKAKSLLEASKRMGDFGYLAKTQSSLCSFLSVKNSLGLKTRKAYNDKDLVALESILPLYGEAKRKLIEFMDSYRKQWYLDNKTQGFDVQEIRMGGLYFRLSEAETRIKEFISGSIDSIPEYETSLLPVCEDESKLCVNDYQVIATVNRL